MKVSKTVHPYANLSGKSGVVAFDFDLDWVEIRFQGSPRVYRYTVALNGSRVIDDMRRKAVAGIGLARYVQRHKPAFV